MEARAVNYVSYSLFGNAPIYCVGALRNAEMAPVFYQDWIPLFWIEQESVPPEVVSGLIERGAQVRMYSRKEYPNGMFKRFCIADDPNVERFLCRDVDSRPSQRERNAVEAWIQSGTDVHALRDHPFHAVLMLGGLWGAKGGVLKNVEQSIKRFPRSRHPYSREHQYGADQQWLWQEVWPKLQKSGLVHDSCLRGKFPLGVPFPPSDDPPERFVGEIIDENEQPNIEHIQVRQQWLSKAR